MAEPFAKETGRDSSDVATEFEIPGAAPSGILGSGFGPTIGAGQAGSIRVKVLKNGDVQYWSVVEGQEPKRVVPTDDERAMVEQIIKSRKEAAGPAPDQPAAQTPDQARKTAADATTAEANAAKAVAGPETVQRERPNAGLLDTGMSAVETVPKAQFDADRATAQDARQRALDLQASIVAQQDKARQDALLLIQQGRFTAEQAAAEYNKSLDVIRQQNHVEIQALTRRGQDISVRGQDMSAGTSQRGQNMSYEQGMAGQSTDLATAMLPYLNAPGQIASTNSLMGGGPPVPTQKMGMPFDPATFPMQAAMNARNQMPSQYQLPGVPAQVPPAGPAPLQLPG